MIAASMLLKEGVSYREGVFQSAQAARLALIEFPELETRKGEGIFQWIRVPGAISSDWLAQQCADQGIRVMPASAFGSNDVAVRASVALGSHTYASFQRLGRVLSRLGTHQRITK
jgi:DNA-binding transcriptional MocR family regulator